MAKYSYRKRSFLNPASAQAESYISVVSESSEGGSYALGTYMVTIADCHRIIELEFPLSDPQRRKQSLRKIGLVLEVLSAFRESLDREVALIEKRKKRQEIK